ncbi:hypothetical protein [Ammoniphilus sp. 3BR4]|uniref:hypothetical protein n=1 Tax=Ammoniphilus sp. 3BR4 TaxID=3158265 RepID=UPI00346717A4
MPKHFSLGSYSKEDASEFEKNFGKDFSKQLLSIEMKNIALFIDEWEDGKDYNHLGGDTPSGRGLTPIGIWRYSRTAESACLVSRRS